MFEVWITINFTRSLQGIVHHLEAILRAYEVSLVLLFSFIIINLNVSNDSYLILCSAMANSKVVAYVHSESISFGPLRKTLSQPMPRRLER